MLFGHSPESKVFEKDTKSAIFQTCEYILPDIADIHLPPLGIKADNLTEIYQHFNKTFTLDFYSLRCICGKFILDLLVNS